ncbi:MAG: CCA tRNA nucleotidyltransferase [Chloroflexota bacterium]
MHPDRLDISRFIPTPRRSLLRQVADLSAELGSPAYLVGGFVRDALLKRPINDFDIVIEGDATKLGRALVKHHGGRVTVHAPFKTATWFLPERAEGERAGSPRPDFIDLISARSETYAHPAALPTVKLGSLVDDLRRRDFTVNSMAVRLDGDHFGELTDPLGGRADLERGLVRVLHPNSFVDDPTRLFRAVRYAARYQFQIESSTEALVPAALPYVDKLSPERLRHELDLIFEEEDSVPMMEKLWELEIVGQVQPALPSDEATRTRFQQTRSNCVVPPRAVPPEVIQRREWRWIVWLMESSHKEIRAFSKRLHFTAGLLKKILAASTIFHELDSFKGIRPSECVARLDGFPADATTAVWFCAPRGETHAMLGAYLTKWKSVKPLATGETLQAMGVPFGPRIGETLWRLRAAWLDGEVTSAEGERKLLEKLIGRG